MKKLFLALVFIASIAKLAQADLLTLNLPGSAASISIVTGKLNASGYLDVMNSFRYFSGVGAEVITFKNWCISIDGIFTAPSICNAGLGLTYKASTKSLIISDIDFSLWVGNDTTDYIQKKGHAINMGGVKLSIPL